MSCRVHQYGAIALVGLLGFAAPAIAHKVECTAPTGVPKAVATTGAARVAPRAYDVEVSTSTGDRRTVVVTVRPQPSSSSSSPQASGSGVTKVLLRSAYKSEAVAQPASFAAGSNGNEAVATFEEAAVRALPPGDVNVILFTPDGERLCQIRKKDRGTLLHDAK